MSGLGKPAEVQKEPGTKGPASSELKKPAKPKKPLTEDEVKPVIASKMAVVGGALSPFEADDNIQQWIERFETFLDVNSIVEGDKMKYLILYGGKIIYNKLATVCAPTKPNVAVYADAVKKVVSILSPAKNDSVAKSQFFARVKKEGKGCTEFALALKELANLCDFGTYADSALRDRFTYYLRDPYVRIQVQKQNYAITSRKPLSIKSN